MSQHFRTIADYTTSFGLPPQHPYLAYVDFKQLPPFRYRPGIFGFYAIILKENLGCGAIQYGLGSYDYQAGTVLCVGPGQLFGPKDDGQLHQGLGKALCIHPTLLEGTSLAAAFASASFFAYTSREALHLADGERASFLAQLEAIHGELETPQDAHSHALLLAHLDLLLHLLARFYERQFTSRQPDNRALLARLETYLASALPAAPDAPVAELPPSPPAQRRSSSRPTILATWCARRRALRPKPLSPTPFSIARATSSAIPRPPLPKSA